MTWLPAADLPSDRVVWAFSDLRRELCPVRLGSSVGMGDARLEIAPAARFVVHAVTGAGLFVRWWREVDLPPDSVKFGGIEERGQPEARKAAPKPHVSASKTTPKTVPNPFASC